MSLIVDWLDRTGLGRQTKGDRHRREPRRTVCRGCRRPRTSAITSLMLVHGAANNQLWFEVQVARRVDAEYLHRPLATVLNWLAYGPILDTGKHIALVAPRPVFDHRSATTTNAPRPVRRKCCSTRRTTPSACAGPRARHIQPGRTEIIEELLRIAEEELPFLTQ